MWQLINSRKQFEKAKILIIMMVLGLLVPTIAAQDSYEDFLKEETQAYNDFEQQEKEAFEAYKAEVLKKWNEFNNSTKRDWYEYSEDLNSMSKVDFSDGEVTIETVVDKNEKNIEAKARENVTKHIKSLFATDSKTKQKVLADQVKLDSGEKVTEKNADRFIREKILPQLKIKSTQTTFKSKDGVERVKVKVTFKLVPEHLKIRAEKYVDLVRKFCAKYDLGVPLVLALMQTESYFNPRAKSSAPAYGLMQLVPKSGARDAYRYVFKKDKVVRSSYLYNPENNIQLGCGYLAKLRDNEFKRVNDNDKKRYCIIASYNTGPGNLSRAINGKRKLTPAVNEINQMSAKELFAKLVRDLPYEETRDYLQKVESRRDNYMAWQ